MISLVELNFYESKKKYKLMITKENKLRAHYEVGHLELVCLIILLKVKSIFLIFSEVSLVVKSFKCQLTTFCISLENYFVPKL